MIACLSPIDRYLEENVSNENHSSFSIKNEITNLALKFGIASKYTSFVGVDKMGK